MLAGSDLSPLPVVEDRGPDPTTGRRPGWPVAVLVGVLAAAALAFPGRSAFERGLVSSWAGPWAAAGGLEQARLAAMVKVSEAAGPDDARVVDLAVAALYDEEAGGLDRLARRVGAGWLFDPGMRALAGQLRSALRAEAADLRAVARARALVGGTRRIPPDRSASTSAAVDLAGARMADQLRRFQLTVPTPAPARLHAADATLAGLAHWLDRPAGGAVLLADTDSGLLRLEIDASRAAPAGWPEDTGGQLIGQPGLIAYVSGGAIVAGPADAKSTPRPIASGDAVIAAGRPDAFWVLTSAGVANPTITEVDGHGGLLMPPVLFPDDGSGLFSLAVPTGIVRTTPAGFGLEVWDPVTGRVRIISNQNGRAIAVWGRWLAWTDTNPLGSRLHLTDTSTAADRILVGAGGPVPGAIQQLGSLGGAEGEFSPDGRRLAYYSDVPDPTGLGNDTTVLTLVDVATGAVAIPNGPISRQGPGFIAWTPDGQRLFYTVNTSSGRPELAGYQVGDPDTHTLRFRSPTAGISGLLALAP
jgi:WD40-like Beta Propeller Repeat